MQYFGNLVAILSQGDIVTYMIKFQDDEEENNQND